VVSTGHQLAGTIEHRRAASPRKAAA